MKIDLPDSDIDELLSSQFYGHLGCVSPDGKQYIVPITYVFEDGYIYSFAFEGRKIAMLRENPAACFQVEDLSVEQCWKSAIIWGQYEELSGADRQHAFKLLINTLWSEEDEKGHTIRMPFRESIEALRTAREEDTAIVYRMKITDKTGRFEQSEV